MSSDRPRYGLLVAALGAIVLAVAVFLPWYGLSLTAGGVGYVQQMESQVVGQFGNAALQGYMSGLHASVSALVGHQLVAVSAHQVLKNINVLLLILAGLGIALALLPLARTGALVADAGNGSSIALLGAVAVICVGYRMVSPPNPAAGFLSLSLREGTWLALLGSLAMVAGGLWPARAGVPCASTPKPEGVWSEMSGWTPEA
ncbi:MAG TPA: hypothetical protein VGG98_03940 [Solirubrobacteraceae bacterium]